LTNQQATRSMQVKDRLLFGRLGLHKAHARSLLGRVRRDIVCRGRSLWSCPWQSVAWIIQFLP